MRTCRRVHESNWGISMHVIKTRQENDPHGLKAVAHLIECGLEDDFDSRVVENTAEIKRLSGLLKRVQELTPGVDFSPYVMRMIGTVEKAESARMARVAVA